MFISIFRDLIQVECLCLWSVCGVHCVCMMCVFVACVWCAVCVYDVRVCGVCAKAEDETGI